MAQRKLNELPPKFGDREDLAQTVFAAVFEGIRAGRFQRMQSREDLWQVLAMVTARRAANLWRKSSATPETGESALMPPRYQGFVNAMASLPDEAVADSLGLAGSELLIHLQPQLREVAILRFNGHSNREVAQQIGKSVKTVERYLKMIRQSWETL